MIHISLLELVLSAESGDTQQWRTRLLSFSSQHSAFNTQHLAFSTALRIAAQPTDGFGHLGQMRERARHPRVVAVSDQIEIKRILPWAAFDWPRLDFSKINVAQRKH